MSLSVGIVGATGYAGAEVVRWVLGHPELSLTSVVSRSQAGMPLAEALPALEGFTDLVLEPFAPARLAALDVVFLAVSHGASASLAQALEEHGAACIVDLARDHRHAQGWVYGQPEWQREALRGATRIAAPGCFATALELSIAPFVAAGVVQGRVQVAAATGSAGSGKTPVAGTHHPERHTNLRAYKVLSHQHLPEVLGLLELVGSAPQVGFVPLSAPVDRGIFATTFLTLTPGVSAAEVLAHAYREAPLVRVRQGSPELRWVRGTAMADVAAFEQQGQTAVLCAIDNLGRGAAAQAVQALNVSRGWPDGLGLGTLAPLP